MQQTELHPPQRQGYPDPAEPQQEASKRRLREVGGDEAGDKMSERQGSVVEDPGEPLHSGEAPFQTFPTVRKGSSQSRSSQSSRAETVRDHLDDSPRRGSGETSSAAQAFPNPYFPLISKKKTTPSPLPPPVDPSLVTQLADLKLGAPISTSSEAADSAPARSTDGAFASQHAWDDPQPRTSTSASPNFLTSGRRRGSDGSKHSSRSGGDRKEGRRRGSHDSGSTNDSSRRGSEANMSTMPSFPECSQSVETLSADARGLVFPSARQAVFPSIQPTRTSRYKPPPSTGSTSPPSSIASSQRSTSSTPFPSSESKRRPPPPPLSLTTSTSASNGSTHSGGSIKSSAASIRSASASMRSSAPSTMSSSTRLSDGPQSIFANPEHQKRPITDLLSLPKFFKKKQQAGPPPGRRAGGSASILDAALVTSQTWANPARAPPTGQRGSFGRSSQSPSSAAAGLSTDALAAAMARNPVRRRDSMASDVTSIAGSEMSGAGGMGYGDRGSGGMRTDVFAMRPKGPAKSTGVPGLGLEGIN